MNMPRGYDAWRLAGPDDESDALGEEVGQSCNRYAEPDEGAPRGYKPKPCTGVMETSGGVAVCDTCGETA